MHLRALGLALFVGLSPASQLLAFGWPSEVARASRELSSGQSSERARAAVRLLNLPPSSARPLVELALEDEEEPVRLAAARAAIAHGFSGLGEQVAGWLKDPSAAIRVAALRVLSIDLEERHVPAVARATLDPDEPVRASAARCLSLARLALAPEVTSALLVAIDDPSPVVRAAAAVGLGRVGDGSTVSALVARLADAEESVRRAAAVALGAVGERKATAALSFALQDRSVGVAALAARSLGELGDSAAEAALERALLEPGWGPLQVAAAEALRELDQRQGWDAIVTRLAEQDAAPSLRGLFAALTKEARASVEVCLAHSGGVGLLECARIASDAGLPLDALVGRVRRGGLPTARLFQVVERTSDVELLVLAIERLARGSVSERRAALELLDGSAPLPPSTGVLLGEALDVPGLEAKDVARLLLLLSPTAVDSATLARLTQATDRLVSASARALSALAQPSDASILAPFDASPLEASVYGHLLARGMERAVAERLLRALTARGAPLSAPVLTALSGIPNDLSPVSLEQLSTLAHGEHGPARDALLPALAAQSAGAPLVLEFFRRGTGGDRRSLAALFPHTPALSGAVSAALSDADPWVRAQAGQGARSADVERLLALTGASEPAYVRTGALLGLSRLDPKRAVSATHACQLLDAPELGVRVGALLLVDRAGVSCPGHLLPDLTLGEREPILRELAAQALRRRDHAHRALRSCRAYDAEPAVARACGASVSDPVALDQTRLEFVEIVPPWLDEAAPNCPYALLDGRGELFVGVTDRRGQAPTLGPGPARVLDPRLAL